MTWNGASLKWSCHLGPSNDKKSYKQSREIKTSKNSKTNLSQNPSHKSKTVGTGLNRIPIETISKEVPDFQEEASGRHSDNYGNLEDTGCLE
ncbi:hypothetical protein RclHR1_01090018 [Rhizophagus clarus]|uniref:Uncharacterized protein n=1 Tax=Rhizophagus clarus TaxID=94130 RepID=A0A2Z6QEY8_9GLOM|nr:hypothetical protein RclHR1_01090018 [Rhizophagus clarus]